MQNEIKEEELKGKLFLIVGPSGSGKGSVVSNIKSHYPGFVYPVSYTTRTPRQGEIDGETYHFISKEKFESLIQDGEFLEYAVVHGVDHYGTVKKEIVEPIKTGAVVIREIDMQGFRSVREIFPKKNLVSIFIKVTDEQDLRGRIMKRGILEESEIVRRMNSMLEEVSHAGECDYQVENPYGKLFECVKNVEKIILDEVKSIDV